MRKGKPRTKVGAMAVSHPPLKKAITGNNASHLTGFTESLAL
jgi:hypothetical protein